MYTLYKYENSVIVYTLQLEEYFDIFKNANIKAGYEIPFIEIEKGYWIESVSVENKNKNYFCIISKSTEDRKEFKTLIKQKYN